MLNVDYFQYKNIGGYINLVVVTLFVVAVQCYDAAVSEAGQHNFVLCTYISTGDVSILTNHLSRCNTL